MDEKPHTDCFLTVKEAAEILNVSTNGLHRFIREAAPKERPPVFRILKNRLRFPRREFLEWATSKKV